MGARGGELPSAPSADAAAGDGRGGFEFTDLSINWIGCEASLTCRSIDISGKAAKNSGSSGATCNVAKDKGAARRTDGPIINPTGMESPPSSRRLLVRRHCALAGISTWMGEVA